MFTGLQRFFFSCHFYRESGKILQRFVVCRIKSLLILHTICKKNIKFTYTFYRILAQKLC